MLRVVGTIIAMLLVMTALSAGSAAPGGIPGAPGLTPQGGPPDCLPGNALENDNVRIWFQGMKGHVKVFDNTDGNNSHLYSYNTGAVVEEDGDGAPVAKMDLGRAFPQTSECEVEETNEYVNLTLTITDKVRPVQGGQGLGDATVTFAYNFNKSANGAKFDLIVDDWPWQSDGLLKYEFEVKSPQDMTVASNGIGFSDNQTGEPKGHLEWAMDATARYDDGSEQEAIVDSDTSEAGNKVDVGLRFTNVSAGYTQLDYDPWASMGDWIIIADHLISLDPLEALIPFNLYREVRNLL